MMTLHSMVNSRLNDEFRFGVGPFKNYAITDMDCLNGCVQSDGARNTFTDVTIKA